MLKILLRGMGTLNLLAAVGVVMPRTWLEWFHQYAGMGAAPEAPLLEYVVRSLSAFYALYGGLLWVISSDTRRHATVIAYSGAAAIAFGLALLAIDLRLQLPAAWTWLEGPGAIAYGVLVLLALRAALRKEA